MNSNPQVRHLTILCTVICALALTAFAGAWQQVPSHGPAVPIAAAKAQVPSDSETYILGPEDVLTITVRNVPEMSSDYMVQLDGTFYFPVVGQVQAGGMSAKQLKDYLEKGLSKELRDPQVTVNIKQLRPNRIYVFGSVGHPGVLDYKRGWRLSELIASAGGVSVPAERLKAIIFRAGVPTQTISLRKVFIDADEAANVPVLPGDSINVQSDVTVRINVVGEVRTPGMHEIIEGQGAVEALSAGGGETQASALSRAKIVRHGTEIPVDLYAAVIDGDTSKNIVLQDNDTLVIPQQYARIAVTGQVGHPGSQLIPDGRPLTLTAAVAEAGGLGAGAKSTGVQLFRVGPDGKTRHTTYVWKSIGSKTPDPVLQDKDIVFVPQSGAPNLGDISGFSNLYFIVRAITGL
ncbi:MAG: polysaccharide biosynthesis/export family protein [Fimbriimonadaceae bacterium]